MSYYYDPNSDLKFNLKSIAVLIAVVSFFWWMIEATEKSATSPEVFRAWQRAHPEQTISYEEFKLLHGNEMLPGQSTHSGDAVVVPISSN